MLRRIIEHEGRALARDRTLGVVVALCALLVGWAVLSGTSWSRSQQTVGVASAAKGWDEIQELKARISGEPVAAKTPKSQKDPADPNAVGGITQAAYLPPTPLAGLAIGQSDVYPQILRAALLSSSQQAFDEVSFKSPLPMAIGRFDLAFIVVFLLPLLIIALTYNFLSAEREQGTMPLLLSQPVRLQQVVLGKALLRALLLFGLIAGFSLVAFLLTRAGATEGAVPRLILWTTMVVAYGLFWFALAISVSSLGRSSATNAVALVALWIALVLIVPALINFAATTLYPAPSRVDLVNAMRSADYDIRRDSNRLLAVFYEDHPDMAPKSQTPPAEFSFAKGLLIVFRKRDEAMRPVVARFEEQLAHQQAFVSRFRYASPALVAQEALNDIAGTGVVRYQHFRSQVKRFEEAWKAFFDPRVFREEKLTSADYASIPRFVFTEEPFGRVTVRVTAGLLGLLVPASILGALGLWRLRRYPVHG